MFSSLLVFDELLHHSGKQQIVYRDYSQIAAPAPVSLRSTSRLALGDRALRLGGSQIAAPAPVSLRSTSRLALGDRALRLGGSQIVLVATRLRRAPRTLRAPTKSALSGYLKIRKRHPQGVPFSYRGSQIRTDDILLPKQTLYQAELHPDYSYFKRKRPAPIARNRPFLSYEGLEPSTHALKGRCSTN